jgi:hypothetical protein
MLSGCPLNNYSFKQFIVLEYGIRRWNRDADTLSMFSIVKKEATPRPALSSSVR